MPFGISGFGKRQSYWRPGRRIAPDPGERESGERSDAPGGYGAFQKVAEASAVISKRQHDPRHITSTLLLANGVESVACLRSWGTRIQA